MMDNKQGFSTNKNKWKHAGSGGAGAVYGLGLIGALFYFIQHATSFTDGLVGILQSIVWPAILVYKALELLKM